jgi:hypothetical protein
MAYIFSLSSLADREDRESSYEGPRFGTWATRAKLLYGVWKTASGEEVLFDRRYQPRWRRTPDGTVTPADPLQWVDDIVRETWLYTERCPLATRQALGAAVLREWGVGA